ncbi:hypothetical protein FAI41_08515 [Acetobacteraceae bacterium]|nr:hypothetical protein FAI41_08515 [Acetobacteraceae bacterium]
MFLSHLFRPHLFSLLGMTLFGSASFSLHLLDQPAKAQAVEFGKPFTDTDTEPADTLKKGKDGEHVHAYGHHPPPRGYIAAPLQEDFKYGPDPEHHVEHDTLTGTNLDHFGTDYQNSSPVGQGSLGDSTGNGWVAPRTNGWDNG